MNRRTLVSIIIIIIVVVLALVILIRRTSVGAKLFVPDPNPESELVHNGSFEDHPERFINTDTEPIFGGTFGGCKDLCGGSSTLESWQVFRGKATSQDCTDFRTGGGSDAMCWSIQNSIKAEDGKFSLDLTGFQGRKPEQFGNIRQEVANTEPGATYELGFWVGSSTRFGAPNNDIGVLGEILGVTDGTIRCSAVLPTQEVSTWTRCVKRFTASAPTTTIAFFGTGSAGPTGVGGDFVGIDGVSLRKVCFIVRARLFGCG